MATTIGALRVELSANIAKFETAMGKAATHMARTQRSFAKFGNQATAAGRSLSVGLTAPLVGIGVGALRSSVAFESAFAGVIKTVDDATDGMGRLTPVGEALQRGFRDLSQQIPIAATELAGIGEVAGQLGIESENILGFTEVMAKLGVTTNLSAEEAAQSLARLANITGLPQTEFERLGSTVVALGNNLATNEAEIVDFGLRIASAGKIAGLTEPQILAIGGAMASVGVQSEAGGTAVQKVLNDMTAAVAQGGKSLEIFAQTAGMSAAEFQRAYREDAGAAFAAFVSGLGQQGDTAFTTLDDLKLGNERVIRSFLSLANAGDLLTDSLALGTSAWDENTALTREAEIRFQTTASQLKLLVNQVVEAGRTLGDALAPVLEHVVGLFRDRVVPALQQTADWFAHLSPRMKTAAVVAMGLAAALGPALIALGGLVAVLTPLVPLFVAFGKMTAVTTALAALRTVLVAVGLAAPAAAAGVVGVGTAATGTTAAVNATTLSLARLRVALLTQLPTFTRWGRAITGAAATAGTAMSGLAAGAGAKLAGAFGGLKVAASGLGVALVPLAPAVAIVATGFASWKLGRWIGETTGLNDAVERLALRLQGFTDEEIRTVQESRKLLEETEKLRAAFDEFAEPLEALAAKDMAAWTNATKEAKDTARELADALPLAEIKVEHPSRAVHEFAAEGKLTPRVMREIGRQASALGFSLEELPPELKNIVTWLNRTKTAAAEAGPKVDELASGVGGLTDEVQTLVDRLRGAGAIQAAHNWAAALDHVRGLTTLTDDETQALNQALDTALEKYRALGKEAPAHLQRLRDESRRLFEETTTAARLRPLGAITASGPSMRGLDQERRALQEAALLGPIGIPTTLLDPEITPRFRTTIESAFTGFGASISQTFARALEGGGGFLGAIQSLGVQAGNRLGDALSGGLAKKMTAETGFLSKGLGAVLGQAAGMAIPLIGPVIGSLIGKLFSIGGPSEAELAGRKTAGAFRDGVIATLNDGQLAEASQAALGGAWRGNEQGAQFLIGVRDAYLKIGKSAADAEAMVTRLWAAEARGPEAVAAVQRELQVVLDQANALAEAEREITARTREIADGLLGIVDAGQAAFDPAQLEPYLAQMQELGLLTAEEAAALREMADEAHTDWQAMEEAARTYGVAMKTVVDEAGHETQVLDESLLGLGHAQAKLTDEAGRLAAAWDLLTGEGARTGAAIRGMTDEAQGFVTKALEMGIALPAAMQPMIEKMIEQRRLTDQNGEKLTDMSQLQFAAPLTSGFDLLADKIQMLIIALGGPSGLSKAVEEMVASAGLQTTELAGEWAAMTTDMKAQFGSFEAFVEFRAMVARAGVSFDTMQSRWAAMTDKQQQRYGTFEAYVRNQVLRKMAREAGLTWTTMRTDWDAMTAAQQKRYGTFEAFVREKVLRKMAREAGLKWKDMRAEWKNMTADQKTQFGNFETFVQTKLDDIAKRDEVTTSVGVTYDDPGFAVDDQTMTVHVRYDDPGWTPPRGAVSAQHGTPFRQFGGGTPAMLHGLERVMTAMEGRGIAAALGRIQQGLGAIANLSGVRALAKGGWVTRPTVALLGEREPEAVIPQSQIGRLGTSVQVHVDARGALFTNEYTSQRKLARIVSDVIVSDLEGTRRLGLH